MEILLFIITRPVLATWWARAAVVAVAASAMLNISPFLPWLRDIEPSRINARWVGYVGLTAALAIWVTFNPNERGWIVFAAWVIIAVVTLLPNTLVHWRAEGAGDDGDHKVKGRLPNIIVLPLESCEDILESLTQPRRDLTVALEAIIQAALQAKKVANLAPDQLGAQVWCHRVGDPLEAAGRLVEETRDRLEDTHRRVVAFWDSVDEIRQLYRQGRLAFSTRK